VTDADHESDEGDDEVVFELSDWNDDDRTKLDEKLHAAGISHAWEESDLIVDEVDADKAEDAIEALEYPDELPAATDDEAPAENEGSYEVMSALFVAADRLQRDPEDPIAGGEFDAAAETAGDAGPPYGIEAQVWQQVQELAANVTEQLDDADAEVIARDAAALRQLLSRYM
jgi:hypothetical protein